MLAYFPEIYPNELLYSVLGRLKCHLGTSSSTDFILDVFVITKSELAPSCKPT